jgi:hypothetical protein
MRLPKRLRSQKEEEHLSALCDGGLGGGWQFVAEHVIQRGGASGSGGYPKRIMLRSRGDISLGASVL